MSTPLLHVVIRDESEARFEGEVQSISSSNELGPFDILPEHTNFITLIREKLVLTLPNGNQKEYTLESGILRCFASKVDVYLGIGPQSE